MPIAVPIFRDDDRAYYSDTFCENHTGQFAPHAAKQNCRDGHSRQFRINVAGNQQKGDKCEKPISRAIVDNHDTEQGTETDRLANAPPRNLRFFGFLLRLLRSAPIWTASKTKSTTTAARTVKTPKDTTGPRQSIRLR